MTNFLLIKVSIAFLTIWELTSLTFTLRELLSLLINVKILRLRNERNSNHSLSNWTARMAMSKVLIQNKPVLAFLANWRVFRVRNLTMVDFAWLLTDSILILGPTGSTLNTVQTHRVGLNAVQRRQEAGQCVVYSFGNCLNEDMVLLVLNRFTLGDASTIWGSV